MWRKGSELGKLKALRTSAGRAMAGAPLLTSNAEMEIVLHADPQTGDLDNCITGVCDGLQAAHPNIPLDQALWADLPAEFGPQNAIVFADDRIVSKIHAQRIPSQGLAAWYEVTIIGV